MQNGHGPMPGPPPPPEGPEQVLLMIQMQAMQLQNALLERREANRAGLQEMARKGMAIDPMQVIHLRVDMMIESIASSLGPEGILWALRCNLAYEERMGQAVEQAQAQGTKAQLAAGSILTPSQIRNLARETGTFGGGI